MFSSFFKQSRMSFIVQNQKNRCLSGLLFAELDDRVNLLKSRWPYLSIKAYVRFTIKFFSWWVLYEYSIKIIQQNICVHTLQRRSGEAKNVFTLSKSLQFFWRSIMIEESLVKFIQYHQRLLKNTFKFLM
jgi:hypothetical protein